ncbi:MAG: phosphoenolpyruvate synthase [archaeon]|nr:phosphoenolpyruvate synthase [archaeon]MCP8314693.1 phosphoenolpyruvate synthase [archaeon]
MAVTNKLVVEFEKLSKDDIPIVGGKNANLGEMLKARIPVPPGFAVTSYAYKRFLEETSLGDKIYTIIKENVKEKNDPKQYEEASKKIRTIIEAEQVPKDIAKAVKEAYKKLCDKLGITDAYVAVRSSATAEDLPDASFAGQQETYLNVKGFDDLIHYLRKCWSSLFTPRAIFYRDEKGFAHEKVLISVGVQKMVNAKAAGVIFTLHPVTGDRSKILIESTWGLGESLVSGSLIPDRFVVDKDTMKIVEREIAHKTVFYTRDETGKTVHLSLTSERQDAPSLTDEEVLKLAELGKKIEEHYGKAQDIEFAIDNELSFPQSVFIVQSRPETVWSAKAPVPLVSKEPSTQAKPTERVIAIKGFPASPGFHIGQAKVAISPEEAAKLMKQGDVLVTKMTNPDWAPYMRVAGSIVTDEGGITCHAAIVSRELGIPCIVGTGSATKVLVTGNSYTIDAKAGVVYEGVIEEFRKPVEKPALAMPTFAEPALVTATKIYMNLGIPEKIEDYAHLPFDGIGLMRIEFILATYIGEHPLYLIESNQESKFIQKMAEGVARVARAIQPRPVVVRFSDFKTNEYAKLKGGEKYEPKEDNPMLGWRGVSRYISPNYEKAFRLECRAIKKCRNEWGLKNVWIMLPFVRTTWEVEKCLVITKEEGLERGRDFKVWLMAEVPSIIFMADEFSKLCDGFSIGSNDLTQLILGTDRDSQILPEIDSRYFDERDPAVLRAIERLIKVAHDSNVTVSICGQAPSVYESFTEAIVRFGIDSVSVNPDVVTQTRKLVASVEQKILLERLAKIRESLRG